MKLKLKIWRQKTPQDKGKFEIYFIDSITEDMSFLEMLDLLNNKLIKKNIEPIAFDHDCREGICGTCGVMINGRAHGPLKGVTACQLHMRSFKDGDEIDSKTTIMKVECGVIPLMEGERSALNILQWLSGIATMTRKYVKEVDPVKKFKQ